MVRETTAIRPLSGKVRGGYSAPIVVECLDGEEFVLKANRPDSPQGLKNELVGSRLLEELGLPVPEIAIINVNEPVAQSVESLRGHLTPAGKYFGVQFQVGAIPLSSGLGRKLMPADIENEEALPGVHVFDTWARNGDRHDDNLLVQPTGVSSPPFRAWMIDHGLITGRADWTPTSLDASRDIMVKVMCPALVQRSITDISLALAWMDRIEGIPPHAMASIPAEAPDEWTFTQPEANSMTDFLVNRRPLTRTFLFPPSANGSGVDMT